MFTMEQILDLFSQYWEVMLFTCIAALILTWYFGRGSKTNKQAKLEVVPPKPAIKKKVVKEEVIIQNLKI
jgi:hypothetical protein